MCIIKNVATTNTQNGWQGKALLGVPLGMLTVVVGVEFVGELVSWVLSGGTGDLAANLYGEMAEEILRHALHAVKYIVIVPAAVALGKTAIWLYRARRPMAGGRDGHRADRRSRKGGVTRGGGGKRRRRRHK